MKSRTSEKKAEASKRKRKLFPYRESEITLDGQLWTFEERPVTIPIFNYTIEPRFNLKEPDSRTSLFVKTIVGVSLSVTTKSFYARSAGFMHFQSGAFFGVGKGLNSTQNNIEHRGYAVSLGFQYIRAPLFGHNILPEYEETFLMSDGSKFTSKKNWFPPSIQVDMYRINKKNRLRGNYFVFGYYKAVYFKFGFALF